MSSEADLLKKRKNVSVAVIPKAKLYVNTLSTLVINDVRRCTHSSGVRCTNSLYFEVQVTFLSLVRSRLELVFLSLAPPVSAENPV